MQRINEYTSFTSAIVATASTVAVSSSELVDMKDFTEYLAIISQGVATTAGVITVSVWESTASTWAGAVATKLTEITGASQTGSRFLTINLLESQIGEGKRFLGVYVLKADTASGIAAVIARDGDRYLG
jgi:hypothetical protein